MKRTYLLIVFATVLLQACMNASETVACRETVVNNTIDEEIFGSLGPEVPEYPGGVQALLKYIRENVQYPPEAFERGIQGRVIVEFIVDVDGSINDAKVVKSVNPYLDEEALRIVNGMPRWEPARPFGKPARCRFTVPVTFRLQDYDTVRVDTIKTDSTQYSIQISKEPLRMTTGDNF